MTRDPVEFMRGRGVLLIAVAGVLLIAGCAGSGSDAAGGAVSTSASSSTTAPDEPSATAVAGAAARPDCPNRAAGSSSADVTDDGTYAALVLGFDEGSSELSFDVVQWLVGQDAESAYEAETGDDSGVPNDYWVVNANPLARTAALTADAPLWLVRLAKDSNADVSTASHEELSPYLVEGGESSIWWITLAAGSVVELCEQYTP